MADNILDPNNAIFPKVGPFNSSNSIAFTTDDSIVDLEKVKTAVNDPSKIFLLFKDATLNKALVEGKLNFTDLNSPKMVISVKQYDAKAHILELVNHQPVSEGGYISNLEIKHQFADAGHADVREISFKTKDSTGKVIDELKLDHTSDQKTFSEKLKSFFHLSNLDDYSNSGNTASTTMEDTADAWINALVGDLQSLDGNLVS
jgi:hypothetical protein